MAIDSRYSCELGCSFRSRLMYEREMAYEAKFSCL
jgi:hypothetical protein